MLDIQKQSIERSLSVLRAHGLSYDIWGPDFVSLWKHGERAPPEAEKPGRKPRVAAPYPRGERAEYMRNLIAHLKPGEAAKLPTDIYPQAIVAQTAATTAHDLWGPKTYKVMRFKDGSVELMREV